MADSDATGGLVALTKGLNAAIFNKDTQTIEKSLRKLDGLTMTVGLLRQSSIGHALKALSKSAHTSEAHKLHAKKLVKTWKQQLTVKDKDASGPSGPSDPSPPTPVKGETAAAAKASPSASRRSSFGGVGNKVDPATLTIPKWGFLPIKTREVCRKKIWLALMAFELTPAQAEVGDTAGLAHNIEAALFEANNEDCGTKYKASVRSRLANLGDAKNPRLRDSVLRGTITPTRFATMSAGDMASDEIKKLNADAKKEGMDNAQVPQSGENATDMFKCSRCHQRKCTYYEKQTRSADEPMTVFVTCVTCGNKWKFC